MASRSTNSFAELMQRFLADLGQAKPVVSEQDLASIVELESVILQMLRAPIESMASQGLTSAPPQGAGDMSMTGMGNMAAPGPTPGEGPRMAMPSPDELRRVLGGRTVS